MKKQLLTLTLLLAATVANAQITKGDLQLGGNFNITSADGENGDFNLFGFTPRAGLLLSDNTSLGLILGYTSVKSPAFDQTSGNFVEIETTNFNYGAFARFYKNVSDKFYLFLEPSFQLSSGDRGTSDLSGYAFGFTGGLTYFLGEKFALEMTSGNITLSQTKSTTGGNEVKQNTFNANFNLANTNFGVVFFLRSN